MAATVAVGQQGKSREIVEMMERRKLDVLCLQETKWKGSKARDLGAGYKLYYHGENGARNGVGVVVRGMHTNGVLEVRRITDRIMRSYAPQVGDERVIGKYGYGARNGEGQAIVDFAHHTAMAVINTFYSKRESHKVTYTSGGRRTQIDYILCRRVHLKEGRGCKVNPGENVAKQHHVVIGKIKLTGRRRREVKAKPIIKW
ncbi:craniofacial development protein 2-like [Penaeus japonicus]|uniref:craniofacial development protein 2-like n=1 Tax=Penaeus japonicus TaxID=27405 RepID=UPI001C70CC8E|nr:craniofacial development protein 2-like [Penaeus japonicus]